MEERWMITIQKTAGAVNILQIDVEDWYCNFDVNSWKMYEDRVLASTEKVLNILKENRTTATFYILGYIAEQHPELVIRIQHEGHEVGTHGYAHKSLLKMHPEEFEEDLLKSITILKNILGSKTKILGYRAPQFSITSKTSWAIDILKRAGLKYDSSVFPTKNRLYGVPDAPRFPYHISSSHLHGGIEDEDFMEVPLSVYRVPGTSYNVPVAGGFYLRFFPYPFIKNALKTINSQKQSAVCYIHPWELDADHPRVPNLKWYHYWGLSSTENKIRQLVRDFRFTSVKNMLSFS
jgi:polysaccharide deacetylase family protein (PEP-CTERM system associated)